ncbi:transketolase [Saccharopolyspora erythraea]|uniref:1-deoxy-D-xylulose-5-phosphate synthase N-terminal domain-containing protein n=1 Tax=Saccharopolyspora erythraea TaxID=1836 RepID=UPI001BADB147|nr:1-deoxy-D-xylulose-5-phosphate synthase N-terminal domain-containing protein [Saccharopolyspora erythraea]QUH01950.1 transketolase [Saccharopolyspora erythraea]
MSELLFRCEDRVMSVLPTLRDDERAVVERELEALRGIEPADLMTEMRAVARAVPERVYTDSADVLLRMHEITGSGNHQSCLSSLGIVRACFELGLTGQDEQAPVLVVGRGHIAPSFYAERYVRGEIPFLPLTALHHGLTGVVHSDLGFTNTMRYSLGVGVAQAVSTAWELTRSGSQRKVVCLAGDGELHEGSAFEALRFAHDAGLTNLVLVVDANDKGIEPLSKPLNRDYLAAYLPRLEEVEGTAEGIHSALGKLIEAPGPAALVCRTEKGAHSFKPKPTGAVAKPAKVSFATTTGRTLAEHLRSRRRSAAVFTADMAARFGLPDGPRYTNVGLAETIGVGMTLGLPEDTVKVVATDAMYYMDSLNMVTEATTSVSNLILLAGRSWGAWGGAHNAFNLLGLMLNTRVYEPISALELNACLERQQAHPGTAHVLAMVDAKFDPPAWGCSADIDGATWVTPPAPETRRAVITFGYAGLLVAEANQDGGLAHLHCAALDPELDPELVRGLSDFAEVISVEYNGVQGGFGERLRAKYLLPLRVHGVREDIANVVHDRQLVRHGMSPQQLRKLLSDSSEVIAGAGARA